MRNVNFIVRLYCLIDWVIASHVAFAAFNTHVLKQSLVTQANISLSLKLYCLIDWIIVNHVAFTAVDNDDCFWICDPETIISHMRNSYQRVKLIYLIVWMISCYLAYAVFDTCPDTATRGMCVSGSVCCLIEKPFIICLSWYKYLETVISRMKNVSLRVRVRCIT